MYLGLDIGEVRTGIALCEGEPFIALPLITTSTQSLIDNLARLIDQHRTKVIVIGLPLNMNGQEGKQAQYVRKIAEQIEVNFPIKVEFFDERLTTQESLKALRVAGIKASKGKKHVDEMSAQIILQTYLDKTCFGSGK